MPRGRSCDACWKKTRHITRFITGVARENEWSKLLTCNICGKTLEGYYVRPFCEGYAHISCIELGVVRKDEDRG